MSCIVNKQTTNVLDLEFYVNECQMLGHYGIYHIEHFSVALSLKFLQIITFKWDIFSISLLHMYDLSYDSSTLCNIYDAK